MGDKHHHSVIGAILEDEDEEVETPEASIEAPVEEPRQTLVGRVWDEERGAPVPEAPDEPPILINGEPLEDAERRPPPMRDVLKKVASAFLRRVADKLDQ